jgi:DegV family protein with EDD domain
MRVVETGNLDGRERAGAVIVTESGSDVPPDFARAHNVALVPTHLYLNGEHRDDLSVTVADIAELMRTTGTLPSTSAPNPSEFNGVFKEVRANYPDRYIVYLGYSSKVSSTFDNAVLGASNVSDVIAVDTLQFSAGQGAVVRAMAAFAEANPQADAAALVEQARSLVRRVRFGFVPEDLTYLRAGGRLSNVAFFGATLLKLHPLIEMLQGEARGTQKLRGSMAKVAGEVAAYFMNDLHLDPATVFLAYADGLSDAVRERAEKTLEQFGCHDVPWVRVGAIVGAHSGPGAFGIGGFALEG